MQMDLKTFEAEAMALPVSHALYWRSTFWQALMILKSRKMNVCGWKKLADAMKLTRQARFPPEMLLKQSQICVAGSITLVS